MTKDQLNADLSTLETRFFEHTYPNDTVSQRLDRLDKLVFGRVRRGSDKARMTSLLMDVPNASSSVQPDASAGSQATSNPNPLQSERPVAAANPDADADSGESADYYPTVTALEEKMTGKSEKGLPVQERLSRLEKIAFGKPSTSDDLSQRVDRLKQYVRSKYGGDENYLASSNAVGSKIDGSGLDAEVSSMEQEVFGKTYKRDNLPSRLTRLEKNVLPHQPAQTFTPIAQRVSRLMDALNPAHVGGSPSSVAYSGSTPSYGSPSSSWPSTQYGDYQNSSSTFGQQNVVSTNPNSNAKTTNRHSLLHKLGAFAGVAGRLAETGMQYSGYGW
jgi:hypothetical protein